MALKRRKNIKPKKRLSAANVSPCPAAGDPTDNRIPAAAIDHADHPPLADIQLDRSGDRLLDAAYRFLTIANDLTNEFDTLNAFIDAIKTVSACEAVGIKMDDGEGWLVYGAHDGFCQGFMEAEGRVSLDENQCICMQVLSPKRRREPSFFTRGGSFVVNDAANAQTKSVLRRLGSIRGACFHFGYRSLGLFPICSQHQIMGVLQVADPQLNRLPRDLVILLEKAALQLGTSLEKARALYALQLSHEDLEEKISQRTVELEAANQALRQEIDQRREAEDRLQQTQRMLQFVFDGISEPLVLVNGRMHVKMTNKAARAYYGTQDPQEVMNKPCYEGLGRFREPCQNCPIPEAVKAGRPLEFERQGFVDTGRNEHVFVYPLKDKQDNPRGAVLRIQDVTEAKIVKQQLDQIKNQASLGMLVSSVAHEIKNPNTFIAFNTSVLKDYLYDMLPILDRFAETRSNLEIGNMPYDEFREDVIKLVDTIELGARRIDGFLANLSAYGAARIEISRQRVSLPSVVDKVMDMAGTKIRQSVNAFELEVAEDLPEIHSDEVVLEQVLVNLLINATQAADKGNSWIRLKVLPFGTDDDYIVILVEDNGCGMDTQMQKRIFEPFYSTKVLEGGTGLGLYVCRNLVHQLGGELSVISEIGKGASFTLELPIKETYRPAQSQPGGG